MPEGLELRFVEEWDKLQGEEKLMTIDELPWPWETVMMERGRKEGRSKGLKEGRTKGLKEGRTKRVAEGLL